MNPVKWAAAVSAALVISACSSRPAEQKMDGRLRQTSHVNEVRVITLLRGDFNRQLLSNGKLSAASKASIVFQVTGPLTSVSVKNGQMTASGAVLATLDRTDLSLALKSAELTLAKAEIDLYDVLAGQGYPARDTVSVSDSVLETAKIRSGYAAACSAVRKARYDLSGTVLKAPFRGRVADITLKRFDQAISGNPFCTLLDDSFMDVDFTVIESDYCFLSVGMPVTVVPFALPDQTYTGNITDINPVVDRNGLVQIRARIKNDGRLLDGMNVKVTAQRKIPNCLVVPRSAVIIRDNMEVLFTYADDGKAHWTYVNILASNGESHAVEANSSRGAVLSEGDRVIISGNLNLADGSSVVLIP